jgi:isocitrate dehydrogenase
MADAVIGNLGREPHFLRKASYCCAPDTPMRLGASPRREVHKVLVGTDVYLDWTGGSPADLAGRLASAAPEGLVLQMLSNRGQQVWPGGSPEVFCVDHWRSRFVATGGGPVTKGQVLEILARVDALGLDFIKAENLYDFDGQPGYSGQSV